MTKILVIEDDTFLMNAYRVKLTKAGFDVLMARDGNEALDMLRSAKPDLAILDLVMPVKDGFAVLTERKNDPALLAIPVIVASNLGQKEDIDRALSLGANDYIVKSDFSLEDVIKKIKKLVGLALP